MCQTQPGTSNGVVSVREPRFRVLAGQAPFRGFTTSSRSSFVSSKRKQGLILEISDKVEQDNQGNSMVRPGDDLGSESSSNESSSNEEFQLLFNRKKSPFSIFACFLLFPMTP